MDSSSPVGCRWCHSIGSERYWRVTARRLCACMRYCMIPAPSRRATMPTARRIATPTNRARTAQSMDESTSPVSKAGSTTWSVDQPSTQASATVRAPNSRLPRVERAKIHGSRLIATQMTANPSRVVAALVVGALVGVVTTASPDSPDPTPVRHLARANRAALAGYSP